MLKELLDDAKLPPEACADLLGIDRPLFHEWVYGNRPLPGFIVPELASVLGLDPVTLARGTATKAPAIWFKFSEGSKLVNADRELVVLIRKLGYYLNQLEELTESRSSVWRIAFSAAKRDWDKLKLASPVDQGKLAGAAFRETQQFGFPLEGLGGRIAGIGDLIRPKLRGMGVLIIESPIPNSKLDGCSFYVGTPGTDRPCLFVNTYKQTWFRRNEIMLHELGHALFDIDSDAAAIDYKGDSEASDLRETRATAFAIATLLPRELIRHITETKGLKWNSLSARDLALLVAFTQVELRTILSAAVEYGFCSGEHAKAYQSVYIHDELKLLSERALSTREYIQRQPKEVSAKWVGGRRTTTIPSRPLRLPVPFIKKVLESVQAELISIGKGAEMLMMEKEDFLERFSPELQQLAL